MNFTKDMAQQVLAEKYNSIKVLSVLKCYGGEISKVFEIRTDTPVFSFIIKIYPEKFHWKLEKEVYLYNLINKKIKIPIPKVIFFNDKKDILNKNYILFNKLEGKILNDKTFNLSDKEIYSIYSQMGKILRKIHSIKFDKYGYIGTKIIYPFQTNYQYMTSQFTKKLKEFKGEKKFINDYLEKNSYLFNNSKSPVLCHNDYHEGNIMINKINNLWKITGIFDVENMLSGDALLDISKTFYYSIKKDNNKKKGFMNGYGSVPNDFEKRLKLYRLYHALEIWCWYNSLNQKDKLKNIEKDIIDITGGV